MAVSPPPTTRVWASRWKAASQVAQYETPRAASSSSPGTPSFFGSAPIARITARALISWPPTWTTWVPPVVRAELDLRGVVGDEARAEALRLVAEVLHHLRAHHTLRIARVVLDIGRLLEQAAPGEALDHERLEVRARCVQRGGVPGWATADDDDVLDVLDLHAHTFSTLNTSLSEV